MCEKMERHKKYRFVQCTIHNLHSLPLMFYLFIKIYKLNSGTGNEHTRTQTNQKYDGKENGKTIYSGGYG